MVNPQQPFFRSNLNMRWIATAWHIPITLMMSISTQPDVHGLLTRISRIVALPGKLYT